MGYSELSDLAILAIRGKNKSINTALDKNNLERVVNTLVTLYLDSTHSFIFFARMEIITKNWLFYL